MPRGTIQWQGKQGTLCLADPVIPCIGHQANHQLNPTGTSDFHFRKPTFLGNQNKPRQPVIPFHQPENVWLPPELAGLH